MNEPETQPQQPADVADAAARAVTAAGQADLDAQVTLEQATQVERDVPTAATHAVAESARHTADDTAQVEQAAQATRAAAVAQAVRTDELLLDEQARRVAAQATEDHPFGVPGPPPPRAGLLRRGYVFAAGVLLAVGTAQALTAVEHELVLVLVAVFVAVGLDPAVRFLTARGLRRGLAVAFIAVAFLGAVAAFATAAVPALTAESSRLISQAPAYLQQLRDRHSVLGRLNLRYHLVDKVQAQAAGGTLDAGGLLHIGSVVVSLTTETIIVLILVVYVLSDLQKIKDSCYRLVPAHRRPRVGLLGDEIVNRVGGYVLGNLLTSVVATAGTYLVLRVLHVPYALVLSVLVGVLDLVPLFGPLIGGALVALLALTTVSQSAALIVVAYQIAYRAFEDYFLGPRIFQRTVNVNALTTVVAVLVGGSLLGVVGALVSVPAAAAVQLVLSEVVYPRQDAQTQAP